MAISSPGIGSNIDVNGIVTQLLSIDRQPLTLLTQKEASFQAKLSAFGTLKGALAQFQTGVKALSDISKFQLSRVVPADSSVVAASGGASVTPGNYALEVSKLAQAQKLAAVGVASASDAIGGGASTTLTFDFGTISGGTFDSGAGKYTGAAFTSSGSGSKTVTIDSTNNSLTGIRDAINKAAVGVSATIVNDGGATPYRLLLTEANTGKTNSVKISVSGDAALSSLLAHDPANNTGQGFSETATAQNADFKIDGIAISKTSNTVTDVIQGVSLNLLKTNVGTPTTIAVTRDTSTVAGSIGAFVKAYNDINQNLSDAGAYNATTKQAALLNGEAAVRTIQSQIRGVLSQPVTGGATAFSVLSEVGVSIQKDGSLKLDSTKLQSKLDSNFDDIAGLFAAVGKTSDSLVSFSSATPATASGSYPVTVSQLATLGNSVGSTVANLNIVAGVNDTLNVTLDGNTSTITLAAGSYASADALGAEVQSKINGVASFISAGSTAKITQTGGVLTLTSNRFGSASNLSITGGNGATDLIGGAPVATAGVDTAGTINGIAAAGSGQYLTGATGNAVEGLKLQITGTTTGARGTINYTQGYAYQFGKLTDLLLGTNGPISARLDGINASLKNIKKSEQDLNDRLVLAEKRYRAQFTALDVTISGLNSTSSFLTQQLAGLAKNS